MSFGNRSQWLSVTVRALLLTLSFTLSALAQAPDENALQAKARAFFAAYAENDLEQIAGLFSMQSPDFQVLKQQIEKRQANKEKLLSITVSIKTTSVSSTTARLRVDIEGTWQTAESNKPLADLAEKKVALFFRRIDGVWLIWQKRSALEDLAERAIDATDDAVKDSILNSESDLLGTELIRAITRQGNRAFSAETPDYERAQAAYQTSLRLARQLDNQERAAAMLQNLGFLRYRQERYPESLKYFEESLSLLQLPSDSAAIAHAYNLMGRVYGDQQNSAQARLFFDKALQVNPPPAKRAEVLLNLANLDYEMGNYDEALRQYEEIAGVFEAQLRDNPANENVTYQLAIALQNIGSCLNEKGEYEQALLHFLRSQEIAEKIDRLVENIALSIGTIHERQGDFDLALKQYKKALEEGKNLKMTKYIIESLTFIGSVQLAMKEWGSAQTSLREALSLCKDKADDPLAAHALNLLGLSFATTNDHSQAVKHFQQSLAKLRPLNDREGMTESHYYLALSMMAKKDFAVALENIQTARRLADEIGKREWQWRAQYATAQIQQALNRPTEAQQALQAAITIIESLRSKVAGNDTQGQAFFENKAAPYLALTELEIAQNKSADALTYAERAKARTLLDVLQTGKRDIAKAMTAAEQEQERKLNNELVALNTQLTRENSRENKDAQRVQTLSAQLDKARLNYEDFRTRLYAAHPELKVQRGEAQPLTLNEAAALLPDARTALLEFVVLAERAHLFVITKDSAGAPRLRVLPLAVTRDELTAKVEEFRTQLANRDQRFGRLARELYTRLLAPAALPAQTRLLIVPDGPLWELPFQALQKANNQYLWGEHVIAYAPSLTVMREMAKVKAVRPNSSAGKPSFFAIGNPALGGASVERAKQLMGAAFEPIPEAATQVEQARRFYDPARSRVLTGAAATEAVLKAEAGRYDVLHLATHGVLNDRNPLYSHVLLAQPADGTANTNGEDGLLEAWELMQMDLHADLAVLSACETARGRVGAGEGMIGLTWALFVAGVPASLVSQWKVRADSTADLMVEFHRQWQTRPLGTWAKAAALQQAALIVQRNPQYRHPFYWAGFVLVGKPN